MLNKFCACRCGLLLRLMLRSVFTAPLLTGARFEELRRVRTRRAASADSFSWRCSLGRRIARSSSYGRPRCRPRTCMAIITNLAITPNSAEKDALMLVYPRERPTVPYALTTSKRTENRVKAGSPLWMR